MTMIYLRAETCFMFHHISAIRTLSLKKKLHLYKLGQAMVSSNSDTEIDFCLSPDHLSDVSHVKQVVSVGYQSQVNGYQ